MPKKKQSSKPSPSLEVKEKIEELLDIVDLEKEPVKNGEVKIAYSATGKFYAKDGFVIGPEGKIVSKKMDQHKAEDIAKKFNR